MKLFRKDFYNEFINKDKNINENQKNINEEENDIKKKVVKKTIDV